METVARHASAAIGGLTASRLSSRTLLQRPGQRFLASIPAISAKSTSRYCKSAALQSHFNGQFKSRRISWRTFCSAEDRRETENSPQEELSINLSMPPQDVVLQAVSEASRLQGRTARTTNVVMGGTSSEYGDDWLELDKKVNTYPSLRGFTAIGVGGEDFVRSMVAAVESVLESSIPERNVRQRESAQGKYVSVKIGPVRVDSSNQVREIYQAMRRDERMKYFL